MDANLDLATPLTEVIYAPDRDAPPVARPSVTDMFAFDAEKQEAFQHGLDRLSHAQRKVLHLIVKGKLNKEIAYICGITQATVKAHVCEIFRKLKTRTRTETAVKFTVLSMLPPRSGH